MTEGQQRTIELIKARREQAKGLAVAAGKALLNPKPVSSEERERRLAICNECEFLIEGKRCLKCGCTVKWKALLEAWHCPVNRWLIIGTLVLTKCIECGIY